MKKHGLALLALALVVAVQVGATLVVKDYTGPVAVIAAVGFLLLAGELLARLFEPLGLPHLSGYLCAGILAGPHVAGLIGHQTVHQLAPVNALALTLIALAGGAELRIADLRRAARSLAWATLSQNVLALVAIGGVFILLTRFMPFTHGMTFTAILGVAVLWGVMGTTRSPAATLAILSQTRAKGPLAEFTLAFIMTSDVVVLVLLAVAMMTARALLEGVAPNLAAFTDLGHELVGSTSLGVALGLGLAIYLRLIGRQVVLVLIAIGFGLTEALKYLRLDPLLTFMIAGFVVQNLSAQGKKLLESIERTGDVVFVVFFATAGTELDLPLLRQLWPVALALAVARGLATWGAHRLGSRLAGDSPFIRRWGFTGMISQAGLALGLAMVVRQSFPSFGAEFGSLAVASLALNEMVGPVLFKLALDRAGETAPASLRAGPAPAPAADG
ncbi:MAG: cation:proton antiporter [Sorangiineae bacterium]|nr:cation:proton antiporter [Polyangiaceae bacterium]MEB2323746.1 cation:proton antiporter [Sorangiineae bacterium]